MSTMGTTPRTLFTPAVAAILAAIILAAGIAVTGYELGKLSQHELIELTMDQTKQALDQRDAALQKAKDAEMREQLAWGQAKFWGVRWEVVDTLYRRQNHLPPATSAEVFGPASEWQKMVEAQ